MNKANLVLAILGFLLVIFGCQGFFGMETALSGAESLGNFGTDAVILVVVLVIIVGVGAGGYKVYETQGLGAVGALIILFIILAMTFGFLHVPSEVKNLGQGQGQGLPKPQSQQSQWQVQTQPQVIQAAQPQQQTQQTQQQVQTAPASGSCRPPSGQQCPVGAWYHCNGAPTYQCPASGIWPP